MKVKDQCYFLITKCATTFQIQLTATYTGVQNPDKVTSLSSSEVDNCGMGDMSPNVISVNIPPLVDWLTPANDLDRTIACSNPQGLIDAQNLEPAVEFCNLTIQKTAGSFVPSASCITTGTYVNTWVYSDICGRTSTTYTQTITIIDTTPPVIDPQASDLTVECDGAGNTTDLNNWLANNGGATATDDCSTVTWTNDYTSLSDDCGETGSATVTFTATDDCGNTSTTSATFTIQDTTDPTIDIQASDLTVECDGTGNTTDLNNWLTNNGAATTTDECSTVTWSNDYTSLSDDCGETGAATVTFTATDDCGNTSTTSATFTIQDTTNPTIDIIANDLTVECDGAGNTTDFNNWLNSNGAATSSDTCGNITWTNDYSTLSDGCGETGSATVTFTATDDCGNTSTTSATFTIQDTTNPTIDIQASDLTVECDGSGNTTDFNNWLNSNGAATSSDTCGGITWTNDYSTLSDGCGETGSATVTFTATDDCGNTSTTSATFTIQDTTNPTIDIQASNLTVECDGSGNTTDFTNWLNSNGAATSSDTCGNITWTNDYSTLSDGCGETRSATVTFTATDDCGNTSTTSATFTIQDTTNPTIDIQASDIVIECDGSGNNGAIQAWLDNNGGGDSSDDCSTVTWTNNYGGTTSDCSTPIEVIFTATDACGNSASTTATYAIQDTTPPNIDNEAANLTVECDGSGNTADLNNWLNTYGGALASDDCSAVAWTNDFSSLSNNCGETGSATVTFTVTDGCGNSNTTSATFTIQDTTNPTIDIIANDLTVECDGAGNTTDFNNWLNSNGAATSSDTCGNITWTNDYSTLSDGCGETGAATITFTATDDCGNTNTTSATFTIQDTTNPTIDIQASDLTVECDGAGNTTDLNNWLNSNGAATSSDTCGNITWTNDYSTLTDGCGETGTATVTFTATDDCGNTSTTSATFTIQDTTNPTIDIQASDLTVECDGSGNTTDFNNWLNSNGMATTTDDCSAITWSNDYTSLSDDCGETGSTTVTFTATDDCGNTSTTSATFTIQDTTNPTIDIIANDVVIECDGQGNNGAIQAWLDSNGGANSTDDCSSVTWTNNYNGATSDCSNPVEVIFTATDDCGNSAFTTATYTIQDTTPPNIDIQASNLTVECDGTGNTTDLNNWLNSFGDASSNDDCSAITWSNNYSTLSDLCGETGSATVTFTATDGCGNTNTTSATFTIQDTIDASFVEELPIDITIECDNVPEADILTATDICDSNTQVTLTEDISEQNDECANNYTITRTWTASDCAGNSLQHVQIITVEDTEAPTFDANSLPQDMTVSCDDTIPNIEDVLITVTDNCADVSDITITPSEVISEQNDECANNYIITRTWTASDCAGNSLQHVQVITVEDTEAPTFDTNSLPQDMTVSCDDTIPNIEDVLITVTDNCADVSDITITPSEVISEQNDECANNYIITRTWTASDCAGNSLQHVQVITVEDTEAPTFDANSLPQDMTVSCDDTIPNIEDVLITVTDNCADVSDITITPSEVISEQNDECANNYIITRTWTASDCAGNSLQHVQVITVEDTEAPTFDANSLPQDMTVSCDDTIPNIEDVLITVTDNCADVSDITITPSEVISEQNDECANNYIITRTWTASDCAGNSLQHVQVITVEDTEAPTFDANSLPQDMTVSCDDTIPNIEDVLITVTDNCADVSDITITPSEVISEQNDECANNYIITRTWTASDCAGNSLQHVQVITVEDTEAPTFDANSLPQDMTLSCDDTIPNIEDVLITVTDNCADVSDITITPSEVISGQNDECANNYIITRTWTATDCAGNSLQHVQIITIEDTEAPTFDANSLPQDMTLSCDDTIPNIEDVLITVTDNCADVSDITIIPSEVISEQNECANNYTITRTWTASDCAGNSLQHVQVIIVEDISAPIITVKANNSTVDCSIYTTEVFDEWLESYAGANATDSCSEITWSSNYTEGNWITICGSSQYIDVIFYATDACGNTAETTAKFTIEDTTPPVIISEIESEITVICTEIPGIPEIEVTDGCSENPTIEFTETIVENNDSNGYDIVRDWTITDECGNQTTLQQIIHVTTETLVAQDTTLCIDDPILDLYTLINDVYNGTGYFEITSGNYTLTDNYFDPTIIPVGVYTIIYYTDDACSLSITFTIVVDDDCYDCLEDLYISKVITPNGDIHNDYFKVTGIEDCGRPNIKIFNRWGNLVYKESDYSAKKGRWRGNAQGGLTIGSTTNLPTGTYYYIIEIENSNIRPITGHVYLGTK